MVRLRDTVTGVVVNVDDALAKRLGGRYTPVVQKPKPRPKRAAVKRSEKE